YRDVAVFTMQAVLGGFNRDAKPEVTRKIRTEYRLFFLAIAAAVAACIALWTPLFVQIWLLPLLVAVPAHALIELPEHIGCDITTPDVLHNTRSIRASKFAMWFVHGNNYHAEHHWLPGIPNNKLHILHERIKPDIVNLEVSYPAFFWNFFRCLRQGAKLQKLGGERNEGAGS
ncbi:MAG: fatty acid desaturase, partial [Acidobacteriota bacterium]